MADQELAALDDAVLEGHAKEELEAELVDVEDGDELNEGDDNPELVLLADAEAELLARGTRGSRS